MPTCPECGAELKDGAPEGLCSKCLMVQGLKLAAAPAAPDAEPLRPDVLRGFGDYELLEEIARGGMGVVYKARQRSLDRMVAVKTLLFGPRATPESVQRFRAEAAAAASLQHPNIVAIHEVGVHQGEHYLAMDLVDGPNLAKFVKDQPLPARRAAGYLKTIAEAVHYAHERGILHRDLKPSNVLIDSNDQPRVTDFGLAKRLDGDSSLTLTGQVLGSPNYLPPEQAGAGRGRVGRRSDVYSLGAMLYHLLTGRPPFVGETVSETLDQVFHREPVPPRLLSPSVPRDLETICLKCVEKEPARRYRTAQALADELGRFLRGEPTQARPVGLPGKAWRWCRRKPAVAALIILLHVVGVVGLAGILWQLQRIEVEHLRAEANLYAADVQLAAQELKNQDFMGARRRLQRIAASPEQREMRGWEWRYLMDRCRVDDSVLLGRHESWIMDVAISPDDKWVASISGDGQVKLWDFAGRTNVATWKAHGASADRRPGMLTYALAFSPDSRLLATGGEDGKLILWEVLSRYKRGASAALGNSCAGIAFSDDGRSLAAVSTYDSARLFTLSNNIPVVAADWKTGCVATDPAFLPDGRRVLVAGYQKAVNIWDPLAQETNKLSHRFEGSASPAAISPDDQWLVAGVAGQHVLERWNLKTRQPDKSWRGRPASFVRLAISSDGRILAAGLGDGTIMLWDMTGEREPQTLMAHEDIVTGLAFSHHGYLLLSASLDGSVRLWDGSMAHRRQSDVRLPHGNATIAVSFSKDSRYLASVARESIGEPAEEKHTLKVWDMSTQTEVARAPVGGNAEGAECAFSPDGRFVAADDFGGILRLYSMPSLQPMDDLKGHTARFLPDGRSFIYASTKRLLRHGLTGAGATAEVLIGEKASEIYSMAVSPDGRTLAATSGGDGGISIHLWDVEPPRLIGSLAGHSGRVQQLAFSPDGQTLASAGWDGKVGLWDVAQRRLIGMLPGHSDEAHGVAFSSDGRTVASCGTDAVRLWNVATFRQIALLETGGTLESIAFSPDGQWLAGAVDDGTVRLWRAPSSEEIEVAAEPVVGGQ